MNELLTVVTSTFNKGERNRASIQSVLDQSYKNFKYIVVDDGSTDNTQEILAEYDDPRLRVFRQENKGFVKTMISVMGEIETPFVAIQGAGDISLPQRFDAQVNCLETKPDIGIVSCYTETTFDSSFDLNARIKKINKSSIQYRQIESQDVDRMIRDNFIYHGEVVMRMSAYRDAGGYRSLFRYGQDFDLWLRIIEKQPVIKLDKMLYLKVTDAHSDIYGNPKKAEQQAIYAAFAKHLSYERRSSGTDTLDRIGEKAFESFIKTISKGDKEEIAYKVAMNSLNSQYDIDKAIEIVEQYSPDHSSIGELKTLKFMKKTFPYGGGATYSKMRRAKSKIKRMSSKLPTFVPTVK